MGLRVTLSKGKRPPLGLAFIRNLSKINWIILLLDILAGLGTSGDPHQKFSDRFAGTSVVKTTSSSFITGLEEDRNFCVICGEYLPKIAVYCPKCSEKQV